MLFDAGILARGWLSVALASGRDPYPVLDRTVHVEMYATGVRLTASDRYLVLTTWVPDLAHGADEPAPDIDEAPMSSVAASDLHGRGKGLLEHLLKLVREQEDVETADPIECRLAVTKANLPEGVMALEGTDGQDLIIAHPEHSQESLPIVQGEFPNWRGMVAGHHSRSTQVVALNPYRLAAVAKLARYHPDECPILWNFGGSDYPAAIEVGNSFPHVSGLVMPQKWVWELPDDDAEAA